MLGTVEGGRAARGIAAVLAYAAARERDKRSLANEALERYRELSLIYDLAAAIGGSTDVESIVGTATAELSRLPHDARGFLLLTGPTARWPRRRARAARVAAHRPPGSGPGIVGEVVETGFAELVEAAADDARATDEERPRAALVVAALRADDRVIGAVGATAAGGAFRAADLKVVTAIAALAGPAIGRALAAGSGR